MPWLVLLVDGKLIQMGTPFEIYNTPTTPYIASFFGTPSIFPIKELHKLTANLSDTDQMACLRAEFIHIESEGTFKGKVEACYYHGYQYQIIIQVHESLQLTAYSSQKIERGENIQFNIDFDGFSLDF